MGQTIAILNQKGGVGKTTTTINVGAYLAKQGATVLVVDLDPQGNATSGLGVEKTDADMGTYEVMLGKADPAAVVRKISDRLYVLPTDGRLAALEVELVDAERREFALADELVRYEFDYILIDCPPSLSLLTINALTAADYLLIPVQAEYYALEGLGQLLDVFQRIRQSSNPRLELLGVVMTMYDSRTSLAEEVSQEVKKHFGDRLFDAIIPRNVRLAEAPSHGKSILEHDRWSKGARAYKQLAKELRSRVEK